MGNTGCPKQCPLCHVRQALASRDASIVERPRCNAVGALPNRGRKSVTPSTIAPASTDEPEGAPQRIHQSEGAK